MFLRQVLCSAPKGGSQGLQGAKEKPVVVAVRPAAAAAPHQIPLDRTAGPILCTLLTGV